MQFQVGEGSLVASRHYSLKKEYTVLKSSSRRWYRYHYKCVCLPFWLNLWNACWLATNPITSEVLFATYCYESKFNTPKQNCSDGPLFTRNHVHHYSFSLSSINISQPSLLDRAARGVLPHVLNICHPNCTSPIKPPSFFFLGGLTLITHV